jgi:hypothetical protein
MYPETGMKLFLFYILSRNLWCFSWSDFCYYYFGIICRRERNEQ